MDIELNSMVRLGSKNDDSLSVSEHPSDYDRDRQTLARLGKKQVLKRNFGFMSMLSFSCTVLGTWEATLILFAAGFENGGPPGLVYQFILVWGGTICTFVTIGELASMAPTAGGQYHWAAMLAPKSTRKLISYMTGWMTILAWIATIATGAFLSSLIIQGLIVLNYQDYIFQRYHGTLITWAMVLVGVFFNTVISNTLPQVEGMFLILHVLGFFAILVPLVYYAPHGNASDIFSTYMNEGGWPTYGLSFMVGTSGVAFSFVGADAAVHMSEEITNAAVNVPRSMVVSCIINGILGFGMLIALIFCLGDPNAALQAQQTIGFPFIEIFVQATRSNGGSTCMTAIIIALVFASIIGFLATCSRMVWSFARDKGLPFSHVFSKVSTRSTIPIWAILISSVIPCLLALINIGSTTVFNDVTSLAFVCFYTTYFVCTALLLYRRVTSTINTPDLRGLPPVPAIKDPYTDEYILTWGPWHVPGIWGTLNNAISCCYLVVIWFFGFFPPATPVEASTMNYSSLVFGAVVLYSLIYYGIWGRKQYKGPIVEVSI